MVQDTRFAMKKVELSCYQIVPIVRRSTSAPETPARSGGGSAAVNSPLIESIRALKERVPAVNFQEPTKKRLPHDASVQRYLKELRRYPPMTRKEEMDTLRRARKGDPKAIERLVTSNLRFVVSVALEYQGRGVPLSDLIAEGNMGLMEALNRFDEIPGLQVYQLRRLVDSSGDIERAETYLRGGHASQPAGGHGSHGPTMGADDSGVGTGADGRRGGK